MGMLYDCLNNTLDFLSESGARRILDRNGGDVKINPPRVNRFERSWLRKQDPNMPKPTHPPGFVPHQLSTANLGRYVNVTPTAERRNNLIHGKPSAQQTAAQPAGNQQQQGTTATTAPAQQGTTTTASPPGQQTQTTVTPAAPDGRARLPPLPPGTPGAPTAAQVVQGNMAVGALNARVDGLETTVHAMLAKLTTLQEQTTAGFKELKELIED